MGNANRGESMPCAGHLASAAALASKGYFGQWQPFALAATWPLAARGISGPSMSALGQQRTSPAYLAMSALPLKADKEQMCRYVRFVPCVDGSELARLFFTSAGWSVQPCVRPIC